MKDMRKWTSLIQAVLILLSGHTVAYDLPPMNQNIMSVVLLSFEKEISILKFWFKMAD